jgi:hypothetical protein
MVQSQRALQPILVLIHTYRSTTPFFNMVCGCRLSNGNDIASVYNTWFNACEQKNISTNEDPDWMKSLGQDIPDWAFIGINNNSISLSLIQDGP